MNMQISSIVYVWRCDALEARLQSAEDERERGRLVKSVMARVGS
jgi:hypothetical protein